MPAEDQNFEMYAGDYKLLTFTVQDPPAGLDLTVDHDVIFAFKRSEDDSDVVFEKTEADDVTVTGAATFTVAIQRLDTEALAPRDYFIAARAISTAPIPDQPVTLSLGVVTLKARAIRSA